MTAEVAGKLLQLHLQATAYLACLAWLAWVWQRHRGTDAFYLITVWGAGILVADWFVARVGLPVGLGVLSASLVVSAGNANWGSRVRDWRRSQRPSADALVTVIVLAALSLVVFDWVTQHTPVSFPIDSRLPSNLALGAAAIVWTITVYFSRSAYGDVLRLGLGNSWALEAWLRPLPKAPWVLRLSQVAAWVVVVGVPLSTTGVASSTLLRDTATALLMARVVASRSPLVILALAATIAALRIAVGYLIVSPAGPPLVEAVVFVGMLVWLRAQTHRSVWAARYVD